MPGDTWLTSPDGSEYELERSVTIGRDPESDVILPTSTVSRRHAAVVLRDARWWLEDRGSYNGTFLNGCRVQPGTPLPLRHADKIDVGSETLLFSSPAQQLDPATTEPLEEVAVAPGPPLSALQTQIVRCLCGPWLAGAGLEALPSNEQIAAQLGTPGAGETVKAALRRIYAKAELSDQPAHAKRRSLCRVARLRGWL